MAGGEDRLGGANADEIEPPVSPLPSLRALIERTVTARDMVGAPLWTLAPEMAALDAYEVLQARGFDVVGVADDPVSRYVSLEDLRQQRGVVDDCARTIPAALTVEQTCPMVDVVQKLATSTQLFVLDRDRVRWIITPADLQQPSITVVVLAYLVAIELALSQLVPRAIGPGWIEQLTPEAREKAEALFEKKVEHNVEIGLEDCLLFSDWLALVGGCVELREPLGYVSRSQFKKELGALTTMRNGLAHGGTLLDGVDEKRAISRFQRVQDLASRSWDLLDHYRTHWDHFIATRIEALDGSPWPVPDATVHIITAWNPDGVSRSRGRNDHANDRLRELLVTSGCRFEEVVGRSTTAAWYENSFAVRGWTRARAVQVAQDMGQQALFEIEDGELRVVRATDGVTIRARSLEVDES